MPVGEAVESLADRLLDEEMDRDPQPDLSKRQCGRLYGVAHSLSAPRQVPRGLLERPQDLHNLVNGIEADLPPEVIPVEPSPHRRATAPAARRASR